MLDIVSTVSIPIFVLFIAVEFAFSRAHELKLYEMKDSVASIAVGIVSIAFSTVAHGLLIMGMVALAPFSPFEVPHTWWGWVLAFVVVDFAFYLCHRAHHEVRVFWAAHVVHHSSQGYNYAVALRQSWSETFTAIPFFLPLALLGFSPEMYLICFGMNLVYQFFVHTQTVRSLGPLEWVMNTPSHHRVHHASNLRYLDKNYAGVFIIWDRLLGSFEPEADEEPVVYGLVKNIDTYNPVHINTHEWAALARDLWSSRRPLDFLRFLFAAPGWRPDDNSATVAQLRAREHVASSRHSPTPLASHAPS